MKPTLDLEVHQQPQTNNRRRIKRAPWADASLSDLEYPSPELLAKILGQDFPERAVEAMLADLKELDPQAQRIASLFLNSPKKDQEIIVRKMTSELSPATESAFFGFANFAKKHGLV